MKPKPTTSEVLQAATATADRRGCQFLPPCADSDANCRCLRLTKRMLSISPERDITAEYDAAEAARFG